MQISSNGTAFPAYHNGSTTSLDRDKYGRKKAPEPIDRTVIAWDMEGMSLSGEKQPQHPVIFGHSRDIDNPLIGRKLGSWAMLELIAETAQKYPHAIHVGFGFRYDANMILQGFSQGYIRHLYKNGSGRVHDANGCEWRIRWVPGKFLTITKVLGKGKHEKVTANIQDYSSFFGGMAFLNTAENILKDELTESDRAVIARGKEARGSQTWEELDDVLYYWRLEIRLIQRVFEKFREVMYQAGFGLRDWYGPGALANYINKSHGIRPHLAGAQVTSASMPLEVHSASKRAFSGGRFELFKAGLHRGPIYSIDINSAYPFALTGVPSLKEGHGFWTHTAHPERVTRFGVYRISFEAPGAGPVEYRPMPLFWRDRRGLISYPNRLHGWYWSPEARMVLGLPGVTIHEGWEWVQTEEVYPWDFLSEMYTTRQRLGKTNLLSMPFKLGPNSLYGKYAQTVGWDKKKQLPPRSHALPIAGWITSYCRSMLWDVIRQDPSSVIAVETDSVYTTRDPRTLDIEIGSSLGQWDYSEYDDLMYIQSGMYHTRVDGKWTGTKSRGMGKAEFTAEMVSEYLQQLIPGQEWPELTIRTKPRFIGAGAALANPFSFKQRHCSWRPQDRVISFGDTGKRRLFHAACPEYQDGLTPWDKPYHLAVSSNSDGVSLSAGRKLPWENEQHPQEVADIRELVNAEEEIISR